MKRGPKKSSGLYKPAADIAKKMKELEDDRKKRMREMEAKMRVLMEATSTKRKPGRPKKVSSM